MSTKKSKPKRSPRTPSSNSSEAFDPRTPKVNIESNRLLHGASTPLSPTPLISHNEYTKLVEDEVSRKSKGEVAISVTRIESKRSLSSGKIKNEKEEVPDGIESEGRRVSKKVGKRADAGTVFSSETGKEKTPRTRGMGIEGSNLSKKLKRKTSSGSVNADVCVDLYDKVNGKTEKMVNRRDHRRKELEHAKKCYNTGFQGDISPVLSKKSDIGEFANEKSQGGVKLAVETILGEENKKNVPREKGRSNNKTMLNQWTDKSECAKGWTEEQEQSLQRAYVAAKPTPRFWKRVSKMVPGKSAQECFDKIHSAFLTPPQAQPRSRAKKVTLSSLSFSESDLLSSPKTKNRRSRYKCCNHLSQKTMRQLLQKQCNNDKDEGADLFSIFEATIDPSNGVSQQLTSFSTPEQQKGGSSFLNRCHYSSPLIDRKELSQLNMPSGESLVSPPVLKHIKNKGLHEKYIDLLHRRETKRKAALKRAAKLVASQKGKRKIQDGKTDAFSAARNALHFDASDAITQFQVSQMNVLYNCDISDNDYQRNSDDESEDWSYNYSSITPQKLIM